jgi:hypothetical protein
MNKHSIFKYDIQIEPREMIQMPAGAQPLRVVVDAVGPKLYALVDESQPAKPRIFRNIIAGDRFDPTNMIYVDTYVVGDGRFVGHLFEVVGSVGEVRDRRWESDMRDLRIELDRHRREREAEGV